MSAAVVLFVANVAFIFRSSPKGGISLESGFTTALKKFNNTFQHTAQENKENHSPGV